MNKQFVVKNRYAFQKLIETRLSIVIDGEMYIYVVYEDNQDSHIIKCEEKYYQIHFISNSYSYEDTQMFESIWDFDLDEVTPEEKTVVVWNIV